jgi:hypothetical protein
MKIQIKKIDLSSFSWFCSALWIIVYFIPLSVNQFTGKDAEILIFSPFIQVRPASSLALIHLFTVVPFLGFFTGLCVAYLTNLLFRLIGGIEIEIQESTEPVGSAKPTPPGTSAAEQPRVPGSGAG